MLKNPIDWTAMVLVVIGGLNWGLVGLFQFDLVQAIFGGVAWLARTIYVLVGLAAVYMIYFSAKVEPAEARGRAVTR